MTARSHSGAEGVLAGRSAELTALKAAADGAYSGRFGAVLLSGEPGIGKTRLAEEISGYARERGFTVAAGHCFDTHTTVSYFPFLRVLHQLEAFKQNARRRARAQPGIVRTLRAKLAGRPLRSAKLKSDASGAEQTRLFDSVVRLVHQFSQHTALLLVLEDLDWADQGSLALLKHAVRTLAQARLLIVVTCRESDATDLFAIRCAFAELEPGRHCQHIRLKGLSEGETGSLVEGVLRLPLAGGSQKLIADLCRITRGNPLFIHQIIRQLIESGRLVEQNGQWVALSGWESRLAAQDGLLELVDFRLSRLSRRCRDGLTHAAVLGEEFEVEVLAHMLRISERDVIDLLDEARSAGILGDAKSDTSADYAFAHAVVRESIYERLSRPAKRGLHGAAARALESAHPQDLDACLPRLALHYARAGSAGDLGKALEYSTRAGEMAYAVCAYADAASHWGTALGLADPANKIFRAQLHERLGEATVLSSATPSAAVQHFEGALKLYSAAGEEQDAARVHARLVSVLSSPSATIDIGQAVSHSRRAEKLLAAVSNQIAQAELLVGEAIVAHAQLRTEDGLAVSQRAMEIGESLEDPGIWCQAAALHGHFLWARGQLSAGLALMDEAFERAGQARDLKPRLVAAWLRGFSYLLLWDPAAAQHALQFGLNGADSAQVAFLRQMLAAHLGIAHVFGGALAHARTILSVARHDFLEANLLFFDGRWSAAEDLLQEQIDRSHGAQSKQQHWSASLWLARLKRVQGQHDRALEVLSATPLVSEQLLRVPEEIATRSEVALVHLARGRVAEARSQLVRCRTLLSEEEDWRGLAGFVERGEAALLAQDGLLEQAGERFMTAGRIFSQYHVPWELAETLVTWGAQLLRAGKAHEGTEKLNAAAQIYRHLGLGACWEARIEAVAGAKDFAQYQQAPPQLTSVDSAGRPNAAGPSSGIYSLATTTDVALLATLIHDAIAHLMNAIDKAAKVRGPIERIAESTERLNRISAPIERLARVVEQAAHGSLSHAAVQRVRHGRLVRHKLGRSHDPGRPL